MNSVNDANSKFDLSSRAFDEFNRPVAHVDSTEYSIVNSFLKSITKATYDANKLTSVMFQLSDALRKPVLELLDEVKGQNEIQLTMTLAAYLNTINSPSTLYGVYAAVVPNYYAARNVLP